MFPWDVPKRYSASLTFTAVQWGMSRTLVVLLRFNWKVIPIVVKRRATIGSGAVILGGVTIGAGAIVGAGTIVTKSVASRTVVAGNPARLLRTLGEGEAP